MFRSTAIQSAAALLVLGCDPAPRTPRALTVYCSVDETFARTVLGRFEEQENTQLAVVFDTEAGKTTGLVHKIIAEAGAGRPRADIFWSGEVFNTIDLARRRLLEPYDSPAASDIPSRFKDREHRWTGVAARPRVLAFDPRRSARDAVPSRWEELADPQYVSHVAVANPLFGTTRGHIAAMFALWGPERGRAFLSKLAAGRALILDGNSATVRAVIDARADFAATDSDDVWVAQRVGASLDLVYPDMGDGGTLLVPCTVAIMKDTPRLDAARRLTDYLVSPDVERMLARSDSRNIPVRAALRTELGLTWPAESSIDYDAVADAMPDAVAAVREILLR